MKTATDNMQMNESGCIPIVFFLQKQVAPAMENKCYHLNIVIVRLFIKSILNSQLS